MPFTPPQNFTGQPAMSIPAGVSPDGLLEAVHLVGRPHDASTIVSLAAQLESARPWAHHRPPATGHRPPATGHRPPAARYRTPASG
jgi:amidase